ncbi:MAG: N-acetyltransferase [Lachnospiraceae bacterium]|nr:N-acetyltransferase [Lachnospiraceae bacterium]
MIIRKAVKEDIEVIDTFFDIGRAYMRAHGNMTQWAGVYPDHEDSLAHFEKNELYVGVADEEDIKGGADMKIGEVGMCFALCLGEDSCYGYIEGGKWLDNSPYATIHMLVSGGKLHNCFEAAVEYSKGINKHLRIDTHRDNEIMNRKSLKCGFKRCGVVYMVDGSPREAYEYIE